jgi:hypothetical protein
VSSVRRQPFLCFSSSGVECERARPAASSMAGRMTPCRPGARTRSLPPLKDWREYANSSHASLLTQAELRPDPGTAQASTDRFDAKSRQRAIATPTLQVGHGNRYSVAWRCPSMGRVAAAQPPHGGAQESAKQGQGGGFWDFAHGETSSVPLTLSPFIPRPSASSEGARDEGAEGRGDRSHTGLTRTQSEMSP